MSLFMVCSLFFILEFLDPQDPHQEDHEVEEHLENVVVGDVEGVGSGPLHLHHQNAADAHHVGPFDDDQAGGDEPGLVLPRTWEEQHQEQPVEPLLEAGALGGDGYVGPAAVAVQGCDEPMLGNGGDVNVEDMFQYPAALVEEQVHRPKAQLVDGPFDGPVADGLPPQIDEMEAEDEQDE